MSYRLPLSRQIEAIVTDPAMGGGVHRDHLAELLDSGPRDKALVAALMFLYRQHRIDFAQNYVIAPAPPKGTNHEQRDDRRGPRRGRADDRNR